MLRLNTRNTALAVLVGAAATILGAWFFEYAVGLAPCPLCLMQRKPHYLAIALAFALFVAPLAERVRRAGLLVLALVLLAGTGLASYHAGVEWAWWPGPSDCSGVGASAPADVGAFLDSLSGARAVNCTEAAWRLFGLSLAGWNALISAGLAAIAAFGAARRVS